LAHDALEAGMPACGRDSPPLPFLIHRFATLFGDNVANGFYHQGRKRMSKRYHSGSVRMADDGRRGGKAMADDAGGMVKTVLGLIVALASMIIILAVFKPYLVAELRDQVLSLIR
jgi:hypothetical protein